LRMMLHVAGRVAFRIDASRANGGARFVFRL
jgi:hypothetical protein